MVISLILTDMVKITKMETVLKIGIVAFFRFQSMANGFVLQILLQVAGFLAFLIVGRGYNASY
jgi:hypothetical protein